jgi:CHAT domain-containing protein
LNQFLKTVDESQRFALLFRSPGLLSLEFLTEEKQRSLTDSERTHGIETLMAVVEGIRRGQVPYSFGSGPIEQLMESVTRGEMTAETALERAAQTDTADQMSPIYVGVLVRRVFAQREHQSEEHLLLWMKLIRAGITARADSPETLKDRRVVDLDFIEIAQQYLCEWADGRLCREANQIGEQLLETMPADDSQRGDVLHVLGTLYLDPYTARRTNVSYSSQINAWHRKFLNAHLRELAGKPAEEWSMPEPAVALDRAIASLEQAVPRRSGHEKGLSLKALQQATLWRAIVSDQEYDQSKLCEIGNQALQFLDPKIDPQQVAAVMSVMSRCAESPDLKQLENALRTSVDQHVKRSGLRATTDLLRQVSHALKPADIDRVLTVLQTSHLLYDVYPSQTDLQNLLMYERSCVLEWSGLEYPETVTMESLKATAEKIVQTADDRDVARTAAQLLAICEMSGNVAQERWALQILDYVIGLAPVFCLQHSAMIKHIRASLWLGEGVNGFVAGNMADAVKAYARAGHGFLSLKMPGEAVRCADKIRDCVEKAPGEIVDGLAEALLIMGPELIYQSGKAGRDMVLRICKQAISGTSGKWPVNIFLLYQFAKGFEFSAALVAGTAQVREDATGRELLEHIAELEREIEQQPDQGPEDSGNSDTRELTRELELLALARPEEAVRDGSPRARLMNLRRSYDTHLNESMIRGLGELKGLLVSLEEVQAALDDRTVLALYYLGTTSGNRIAVHVVLISRERAVPATMAVAFPSGITVVKVDDQEFLIEILAWSVAQTREKIQMSCGNKDVCDDGAEQLTKGMQEYFGEPKLLEQFRAEGKDHLCIAPHNALHYFPFHLLNYLGKPMAESWAVSFLPNLNLLVAGRGRPHLRWHRGLPLASVGMSYKQKPLNPWNLPALDDALEEAREVAAIFDAEPIAESRATVSKIKESMIRSNYVHLSLHGGQAREAPAFHCVFAAPDETSDGRLFAHEVLRWDLRGVDLLTLSACDSGLGRFDDADNLRGLPASFLLAGVSTIVGTLWEVSADTSRFFFAQLYQALKSQTGKLDAFWSAQRETRKQFPKYFDWGAFYLVGEWE